MQPTNESPRDTLTSAQVISLLRDKPDLHIKSGIELLDQNLNFIMDFTDDLVDGSITRAAYADIHGTGQFNIDTVLPWGRAVVRPYMTCYSGSISARFNLGAYFTSTPEQRLATNPRVYEVECYDILQALDTPTGEAYSVKKGAKYLTAVQDILDDQGFTKYIMDRSRAATTLPSARVWPLEENTTWLIVINDLLGAVGYRGIYSDWNGYLRCEPYIEPAKRLPEWSYDTGTYTGMMMPDITVGKDYYAAPNKWVAIRNNNVDGATPVEGDGIYTFINQSSGESSINERGGRVITRILAVDAADQDALISRAQISIEADLHIKSMITCNTSPNPLHWHFDRLQITHPDIGLNVQMLESSWTMNLKTGMMSHAWAVI